MLDDKISCISKGKSHSFLFVSISYLVRLEMRSDAWSWLLSLIIAHASHYTRKTAVWMTAMALFYQRSRFLADLGGIEERSGMPIKVPDIGSVKSHHRPLQTKNFSQYRSFPQVTINTFDSKNYWFPTFKLIIWRIPWLIAHPDFLYPSPGHTSQYVDDAIAKLLSFHAQVPYVLVVDWNGSWVKEPGDWLPSGWLHLNLVNFDRGAFVSVLKLAQSIRMTFAPSTCPPWYKDLKNVSSTILSFSVINFAINPHWLVAGIVRNITEQVVDTMRLIILAECVIRYIVCLLSEE